MNVHTNFGENEERAIDAFLYRVGTSALWLGTEGPNKLNNL